jgi:ribosome-associated protein
LFSGYDILYNLNILLWYRSSTLKAIEVARKAVEIVSNKQAVEIVLLDVRSIVSFADYFVICNGQSSRQINAIYDEILLLLKREGILPYHREGTIDSGWLLLDYGDVVIHIFAPKERHYYQLDELWSQGKPIVRIQ